MEYYTRDKAIKMIENAKFIVNQIKQALIEL